MKPMQFLLYFTVFLLILLGIGNLMSSSPFDVIIPALLIGLIVYCVKYPPAFLDRLVRPTTRNGYRPTSSKQQAKAKKERPRSKTVPFKVIEGGRDDNETPRYH